MSFTTSIITGGSNNHETTSTEANATATDFFSEGVIGAITNTSGVAPATGSFAVNADSPASADVIVSAGTAYTTATPTGQSSQLLRTVSSASETVTIAANSTGGTRYDWIYLAIDADNAADSDASASNVASLVTSRSTSSSSDDGTPPTYGTLLAVVTVANGFSTISNGSITDSRERAPLNTNVGDGLVSNRSLDTTTGELGGAWQSWSPTYTSVTVGNGTVTAKYTQIGKTVIGRFKLTMGSTTSIGNDFRVTLPVEISSEYSNYEALGTAIARDSSGANEIPGVVQLFNGGASPDVEIRWADSEGSSLDPGTFPFAEADTDRLTFNFMYEAA